MTVLHQNLRNDRGPPKFKKWPCSTKKSQFLIFICSLRFLSIGHASGSIKIGEKLRVWFFQSSGPLKFISKFAYQPIFTFIRFLRFHLRITSSVPWKKLGAYDCPLGWRGKYYRSCVRNFHEPMKFCQICCQLTNFHFCQLSKVFMTVLHQNMTNDIAPPKYDKRLCSTQIWEMTEVHRNLRNDRAPPKNPNFLFSSAL